MPTPLTATECRRRYAGAFRPAPLIYWADFLISAGIGWYAFILSLYAPSLAFFIIFTLVAVVALLRATVFIHELAHLKRGALPGFEATWNLLVGIPFMLPSLMYVGSHGDHHRQAVFGTRDDPEYAPLARWGTGRILRFLATPIFVPALLILRWGVLGPLSFLVPWLRRVTVARASSLVINLQYRRPVPRGRDASRWVAQEVTAAACCWGAGTAAWWGILPLSWLMQWYVVAAGVTLVNQIRTLAAHRYENDGRPLTAVEQLLDSINLCGWPIPTVLAAPVGLRYHALHHFLPTVPYHSLGQLHRRLVAELPEDSPYQRTERSGIVAAVWELLRPKRRAGGMVTLNEECAAGGASLRQASPR